jgi:uncharacterized protein (TIGR04222 family)
LAKEGEVNPFDLYGPEFLLFYIFFSVAVIALLVIVRRALESGPAPRVDLADPYLIAYLRGGKDEAIRIATIALVDRGLLEAKGTRLKRVKGKSPMLVRRLLEQLILEKFGNEAEAEAVFTDAAVTGAAEQYGDELQATQLLPDQATKERRRFLLFVAVLALAVIAWSKVYLALMRGRTNVAFLIILSVIAIIIAITVSRPRLTARGSALMKDLRKLYEDLRMRASLVSPGGATIEAAMIAAVFGAAALPIGAFAFTREIFPSPQSSAEMWGDSFSSLVDSFSSWTDSWGSSSSSSDSGGSSCSSSSSCGSSCGGGGCGGGCGGCGS